MRVTTEPDRPRIYVTVVNPQKIYLAQINAAGHASRLRLTPTEARAAADAIHDTLDSIEGLK